MLTSAFAILAILGGASAVPVNNGGVKLPVARSAPGNSTEWLAAQADRTLSKYYKHLTPEAQNKITSGQDGLQRRASAA